MDLSFVTNLSLQKKTGYMEESWHIRYVGEDTAKTIHEKNISLEEYLNAPGGDYVN